MRLQEIQLKGLFLHERLLFHSLTLDIEQFQQKSMEHLTMVAW